MKKLLISFFVLAVCFSFVDAQRKRKRKPRKRKPKVVKVDPRFLVVSDTFEKSVHNYWVAEDGKAVKTEEVLFRVNSKYVKNFPMIREFVFNSDIVKLELLEAYKVTKTGTKIPVTKENVSIRPTPQAAAAPAFSSLKVLVLDYGKISTGEKFYFKTKTTDLKTMFPGKFSDINVFTSYFEYDSIEVNVYTPKGFPLKAKATGIAKGLVTEADGLTKHTWTAKNLKAKRLDAGQTDYFPISPRIVFSNFANYQELGNFYRDEAEKKAVITPAIQNLADKITEGVSDPAEQAGAIYLWVNKNIRYLSIILDRGGWIPHSAESIVQMDMAIVRITRH